jgi:hypothetical protein
VTARGLALTLLKGPVMGSKRLPPRLSGEDSPTVRDDASVSSGERAHASRLGVETYPLPALGPGACAPYPDRSRGLFLSPVPEGSGVCLRCTWADVTAGETAAIEHTRRTRHPTVYRGASPASLPDGLAVDDGAP